MSGVSLDNRNYTLYLWFVLCLALSVVPISCQSLWMDEADTAFFAAQQNVGELVKLFLTQKGSEVLMPGYLFYMFSWTKVFGLSELSLRMANLPFFFSYLIAILFLPLSSVHKKTILLISCISPFVWYNLNEARSNIALFCLSGISLISLCRIIFHAANRKACRQSKVDVLIILFSTLVGSFFNMLFLFAIPALIVTAALTSKGEEIPLKNILSKYVKPILYVSSLFVPLCAYYISMLISGAGGMKEEPGLRNAMFCFYEFMGFSGLGPPRNVLRMGEGIGFAGIMQPYLACTAGFAILLVILIIVAIFLTKRNAIFYLLDPYTVAFSVAFLLFFTTAYMFSFRFWGRHIIFLYPYLIFYLSYLISAALQRSKNNKIIFAVLLTPLLFWCFSDYTIRFNREYEKDNYRLAVQQAIDLKRRFENNLDILWAGSLDTARYYGLRFHGGDKQLYYPLRDSAISVINWDTNRIRAYASKKHRAIVVVFNKKDLYDSQGGWCDTLKDNRHKVLITHQDFSIFELRE